MPLKPMLGVDGLIAHSKEKGITFEIISEDEAKDYLGSKELHKISVWPPKRPIP